MTLAMALARARIACNFKFLHAKSCLRYIYQLHATAVCADYISCQHAPYNQGGIELPEETELIKSTKADSAKSLRLT